MTKGGGELVQEDQRAAQTDPGEDNLVDQELGKFFDGKLAQAIDLLPDELKFLSEDALYERLEPTPADWKIRQQFTDLIKEARAMNRDKIVTTRVYEGVVTRQTFHLTFLSNPVRVAWISRPIIEHTDYYNAIHKLALAKIFRMVKDMPEDTKYLPQLMKIAETAGNRVHGPVVQRIQMHTQNRNIEIRESPFAESANQEEISRKIEAMQAKLIEAPKDVTPTEE